ncbi:MAG: PorT family protein [Saprospiraceae bacterium]|nr:PorT family protein [Saprospiraceae bacterium]
MQDNYENGVNQPLVDRGWEEMRRLLDKEMPVAPATTKPSRRILPMWWLAAACITAIALGGAWYWNVDNPRVSGAPTIADAAAPVQTQSVAEEKISSPAVVDINPSSLVGDNTQSDETVLSFNNKQTAINTLQTPVQFTAITTAQENTSSVVFLDKKQQDSAADPFLETTSATLNETPVPAAIDALPGISHAFLVSPNPALGAAASALKASPSWLPDNLAVSTGIISGDYSPVEGFQVGVDAQYALGGKWSLVSSPAYRFQRQSLSLEVEATTIASGPITLDEQLDAALAESVSTTNNIAPSSTYYTALKNHYVDVPIQIAYQVGTRFRLEAGPSFSYLAGVYEGSPFGNGAASADTQSFYNPTASRSWYSAEADDKLNPVYFNRLDIGVNLGVTYRPAQWLGLRLQYRQGFVDMLKTQSYELRNRQLALSTLIYW